MISYVCLVFQFSGIRASNSNFPIIQWQSFNFKFSSSFFLLEFPFPFCFSCFSLFLYSYVNGFSEFVNMELSDKSFYQGSFLLDFKSEEPASCTSLNNDDQHSLEEVIHSTDISSIMRLNPHNILIKKLPYRLLQMNP